MSKDPAFLFYSSDFLTGVSDLTFEERGQYITLLCLQHQKGRLTKKAIQISIPNVSHDVLAKFKIDENGFYFNSRLEVESEKRLQHTEKQRERALNGWKKRKEIESSGLATANATALPLENENENENKDDNTIEVFIKKPAFDFKKYLINYGFDKELVNEWILIRKAKKAINTEMSFKKFISQIEMAPEDKNDVLRFIVEKQWKGFQYEWLLKEQIEFKKIAQNGKSGQQEQLFGRQTADTFIANATGWGESPTG